MQDLEMIGRQNHLVPLTWRLWSKSNSSVRLFLHWQPRTPWQAGLGMGGRHGGLMGGQESHSLRPVLALPRGLAAALGELTWQ